MCSSYCVTGLVVQATDVFSMDPWCDRAGLVVHWTRVHWTRVHWTRVPWTRVHWTRVHWARVQLTTLTHHLCKQMNITNQPTNWLSNTDIWLTTVWVISVASVWVISFSPTQYQGLSANYPHSGWGQVEQLQILHWDVRWTQKTYG